MFFSNVSLPFQWMIYKPQFDSPGSNSASKKYDRVPDVDSVFSIHPPTGVLPPAEQMEFKITYAPPIVSYLVVSYIQISRHLALNCEYFLIPICVNLFEECILEKYFLISQLKHMLWVPKRIEYPQHMLWLRMRK